MSSSSILDLTLFKLRGWSSFEGQRLAVKLDDRVSNRLGNAFSEFLGRAVCIAKKDARIYYFKPQILGFGILIPAFVYLSFSLGREIPPDLLIPGLVGMVSLFGASSVEAISITIEKQTETYELLQTAPVSTTNIVFGKSLAGSAFGIMFSLATATGAVMLSGGRVANPLLFMIAAIVGAFAFSALGMVVAAAANDMPTANMSLTALRLPMIFISGVFMPVETLPLQLRVISYLTPLTYLISALREAMMTPSILFAANLLSLLAWLVVLQVLAVIILNKKTQF
jgi:ABC-2 type transport system permease protein